MSCNDFGKGLPALVLVRLPGVSIRRVEIGTVLRRGIKRGGKGQERRTRVFARSSRADTKVCPYVCKPEVETKEQVTVAQL
jgi:hypothetical protein